jgi:hypothetical protein
MDHVVQGTARLLNDQYYCTFRQLVVAVVQTEMPVGHVPVDCHVIGNGQASLAPLSHGAC